MRQYFISVACWICTTEKFGLTSHLIKSLNNVKVHTENDYIVWHDEGSHQWVFFFKKKKATMSFLTKWIGFGCALAWPSLSPDLILMASSCEVTWRILSYAETISDLLTLRHHITEVSAAVTCYAWEQMEGAYHFDGFQATNIAHTET